MKTALVLSGFLLTMAAQADVVANKPRVVLTDLSAARAVGGEILSEDTELGVAAAYLSAEQISSLSHLGHATNKCAGFETLSPEEALQPKKVLNDLRTSHRHLSMSLGMMAAPKLNYNSNYQKLIDQSSPAELKKTITWLSSYTTRYNASKTPNTHVNDLKSKLQTWLKKAPWSYTLEIIKHKSTAQTSLKLRIPGKKRPSEVVVLGAHLDSINQIDLKARSPGADDNASGSSNLIESLKLLTQIPSFDRTLEFYWYAGEEDGLLGSKEIAQTAKKNKTNVIGVLQLDMTLFSGAGNQVIGSMTDFTSPWLRGIFYELNTLYVKNQIIEDQCGYGCSDHASWYRQDYPTIMPFETTFNTMNHLIHTDLDLVNNNSNFEHSDTFTKYAALFAVVLGNSTLTAP